MAPPISFGLGLSLARAGGGAPLDADAAAYIAAVETAGATVNTTQKAAINTFFKTGKSDGWYSSIKRMYLPIWASAAPNAIDMIGRTSGTFNGTVTHSAGYVQGDGSTGYFDTLSNALALGASTTDNMLGFISTLGPTGSSRREHLGGQDAGTQTSCLFTDTAEIRFRSNNLTLGQGQVAATLTNANTTGVITAQYNGTSRDIYRRNSAGGSTLTSIAGIEYGSVPTLSYFCMGLNNIGTPATFSDGRYGSWFIGSALSSVERDNFTLALKNLYEATTGLTLP